MGSIRSRTRLVAVVGGLALGYVFIQESILGWRLGDAAWILLATVPTYALGVFVVLRRPEHPQTRRLLWLGTSTTIGVAIESLARLLYRDGAPGPHFWVLNLLAGVDGALQIVTSAALIALFPDGVAERPGIRWAQRAMWGLLAIPPLLLLTRRDLAVDPYLAVPPGPWPSPFFVGVLAPAGAPLAWIANTYVVAFVGPVLLVLRYRVATPERRALMRWFLYTVVLACLMFLGVVAVNTVGARPQWFADAVTGTVSIAAILMLMSGIVVGMLRHRLFDIEVVIRRSTAFATLWLLIAAAYVAVAAAPGLALGGRIPVQVAVLVSILVAVSFQPLRRRLERAAERMIFGDRVDPYELVQAFGGTLEQSIDLAALLPRLADTVRSGLGAPWVRVTLIGDDESRLPGQAATSRRGDEPPGPPGLTEDLSRAGQRIGVVECGPKEGGYGPADRELLATLLAQATTAIANVRLAAQLSERLAELDRSRARIVSAQDVERRRIERNIHDGAQQQVVALITKLRLARNRIERDRPAGALLAELQGDARDLLVDLRELAQGIHPPVLSDNGLVAALEARAGRLRMPVAIRADEAVRSRRLAEDVEGAAYFVVCEALTNVAKHAGANQTHVVLNVTEGQLLIEVRDDGTGFDRNGTGPGTGAGRAGRR